MDGIRRKSALAIGSAAFEMARQLSNTSLRYVNRKVMGREPSYPWMRPKEVAIVEEILRNLEPTRCLEWGTGYSTTYLARLLRADAHWISVEHDEEWASRIRSLCTLPNVQVCHVASALERMDDLGGDSDPPDFSAYVDFPARFAAFDFILIDGRARRSCALKALDLVNPEGVVVLHDANRAYYQEPLQLYPEQALFGDGRGEDGGIWIGSRGVQIRRVLDVEKHKLVWWLYEEIGGRWRNLLRG